MKGNCGECSRRWACDIDPNKCNEWPDPAPMTNAQKIRAMSDEELTVFLSRIAYGRKTPWSDQFAKKFCSSCPTTEYKSECYLKPMHLHECDFTDGKCPNGNEIVWWLRQPCEGGE